MGDVVRDRAFAFARYVRVSVRGGRYCSEILNPEVIVGTRVQQV